MNESIAPRLTAAQMKRLLMRKGLHVADARRVRRGFAVYGYVVRQWAYGLESMIGIEVHYPVANGEEPRNKLVKVLEDAGIAYTFNCGTACIVSSYEMK